MIVTTGAESIVFCAAGDKTRPMSKSVIEKQFYRALGAIGIDERERRERGIVLHSHRHTLNTLLRSRGVPAAKVRAITGHRSAQMSDWYTNFQVDDFHDVLAVAATIGGGE